MPIFEFLCRDCGNSFELISSRETTDAQCPACESRQTIRIMSITHYRNADHWEKNMLNGITRAKEKDKLKAEMKAQMPA